MADVYAAKKYDHLLGIEGLSDTLMTNHFTLYEGYVKNANLIIEKLRGTEIASPEHAELQRRFGWEWNGMRLHEFYFGGMTKEKNELGEGLLLQKLIECFGSFEKWSKNFTTIGAMRGMGWAILYEDLHTGELLNVWVNEHDMGHLAGSRILVNMDVFEHAFMIDYGTKRADYIETFMRSIDWKEIERRYQEGK
ncbi:MAG: Fe-Mn family superoxide dismutase [Candidatus Moraniibacteriota bacterium]